MNHEQEALEAAQAGRWDIANFHAQMRLARELELTRELTVTANTYNIMSGSELAKTMGRELQS